MTNKELATALRLLIETGVVATQVYWKLKEHAVTTNNDRDSLRRYAWAAVQDQDKGNLISLAKALEETPDGEA